MRERVGGILHIEPVPIYFRHNILKILENILEGYPGGPGVCLIVCIAPKIYLTKIPTNGEQLKFIHQKFPQMSLLPLLLEVYLSVCLLRPNGQVLTLCPAGT